MQKDKVLFYANSSMVTKDIPENAIALNNPAKVIRHIHDSN